MAKKKTSDNIEFDFFEIDINRLDEEWINQPKIFFEYASQLAKAQKRESQARADRELIKAEIDLQVRKNLKKYKIDKVKLTESVILGIVFKQPKYLKAQKRRLKMRYRTAVIQAAVNALNHRKSALEKLVSLHGQNYFSIPKPIDERSITTVTDIENKAKKKRRQEGLKRKKKKE